MTNQQRMSKALAEINVTYWHTQVLLCEEASLRELYEQMASRYEYLLKDTPPGGV